MYLGAITVSERDQLLTQLFAVQAQLQAAQAALNVCQQNDPNGVCHDSNVTMAVTNLQNQLSYINARLSEPVIADPAPSPAAPTPVGPSLPSTVPPSAGTPPPATLLPAGSNALVPSLPASPFGPTDIDVQSVTGNTSALMPGSAGAANEAPAKDNKGLVLLLLAAAAAMLGG